MKKVFLFLTLLPLLVLTLAATSYSWQGRMAGMGDPYGLVQDESDLLIHPAKIAAGEGVRFYGNYRFTYTDVLDWDVDIDADYAAPLFLLNSYSLDISGAVQDHEALLGAAFPLGPGRMGLFFTYEGRQADYDGEYRQIPFALDFSSDLDDFSLKLLYGLPLGSFSLGGEMEFAYRLEQNESFYYVTDLSQGWLNWDAIFSFSNGAFMTPIYPPLTSYDSGYLETLFKAGAEGSLGHIDTAFSLRGGVVVTGDNSLDTERFNGIDDRYDLDGEVGGWRVGGDLWLRYPLTDNLSLPFLVRADYQVKSRDGDGVQNPGGVLLLEYEHEERGLQALIGGGLDAELTAGTRVAAGIYYNYVQSSNAVSFDFFDPSTGDRLNLSRNDWPDLTEHRAVVMLAGEQELSSVVALRMGLSVFYGWAREDLNIEYVDNTGPNWIISDFSLDGPHWGVGGSIGATVKFQRFSLEPFINGGYQLLDLSGDGDVIDIPTGTPYYIADRDKIIKEWYIGGGFSVLFDY